MCVCTTALYQHPEETFVIYTTNANKTSCNVAENWSRTDKNTIRTWFMTPTFFVPTVITGFSVLQQQHRKRTILTILCEINDLFYPFHLCLSFLYDVGVI